MTVCGALHRSGAGLLALSLAACAAHGTWQKPGADPAAMAGDNRECRSQADKVLARNRAIDQDIAATSGADWERAGTAAVQREQMAAHSGAAAAAAFAACMQAKGYVEARPAK
jgi:hypothetical protein